MAGAANLTEMLKHLGWGSGFRLPIANDENRELERILEMKQSNMVRVNTELQETIMAVDNSASFYRHLNSKIQHVRDVEAAKRSQFEKERHLHALAERDNAKSKHDAKVLAKSLRATQARNKVLEGNILRRKDILGELVDTINFDKTAIAEYENKFNKEDSYLKLIEEFAESDKEKYEQCKKEYRQLGEKIANSRKQCNQTVLESEVMEEELESLAKRFRKAHAQRKQMIENWRGSFVALEGRDKEIIGISHECKKVNFALKKTKGLLSKQEAFYENIRHQSRAYTSELSQIERMMTSLQGRKKEAEASEEELTDAISELASYIFKVEKELRAVRKEFKNLNNDTDEWKEKIDKAKEELANLKEKYDLFAMESMTSGEHVKQLEEFLDNEERKGEALAKDLMKQINYKSQRERQVNDLSNDSILADVETKNLKASIASSQRKTTETGELLVKTKSVAYGLDIQSLGLIAKIRSMENPESMYSKEEYSSLLKEIAQLKGNHQELLKTQLLLKTQANHCENVINFCKKEITKEHEQAKQFATDLHMLNMETKRIGKDDETALEAVKDIGVNNSLLHVQLSKMLQMIKNYEEKLFSLEQERVTLNSVVKARKRDIENYYTLLLSKKRVVMDECQKLKLQIHEVSFEADARKRKYEMIMLQMWKSTSSTDDKSGKDASNPSEEGKGRSEAYFIIKLAQEREHYRQEGDKWDERVKEAEKIVEGLQNTLALMMGTNEVFKDSLKPATGNTVEGRQLEELKEKEYAAVHNMRLLKLKRKDCMERLTELQCQLDAAISAKSQLEYVLMEKQYDLQNLIVEINGQKDKIRRATQQANKLVKELSKLDTLDAELLQNDLRLRVTKEKYEFACATLEKLLLVHPHLTEEATGFMDEKGMGLLKERICRKMNSPSLASSPHQSGRSTPQGSTRTVRTSDTGDFKQTLKPPKPGFQKSIVFSTLTSAPSVQHLLGNITRGVQESKKKRMTRTVSISSTVTGAQSNVAGGEISFGDLRQTLQDAVAEQLQTHSQLEKVEEELEPTTEAGSSGSGKPASARRTQESTTDVVELLDNKEDFDDAATDH